MDKKKDFILNTLYYALIGGFAYIAVMYGIPILMPFIIAFIVASIFKKPSRFIGSKFKIKAKPIHIFFTAIFYCFVAIVIIASGGKLVSKIASFAMLLPNLYKEEILPLLNYAFNSIVDSFESFDITIGANLEQVFNQVTQLIGGNISNISMQIVRSISNYAASLPGFFIKMIITIISTFFIVSDEGRTWEFVKRTLPEKFSTSISQGRVYVTSVIWVYIKSYSILMSLTFVELLFGFFILGINNPVPVALIIAVFDILPVLGAGGVLIPWAIIMAVIGNWKMTIGLLVLYLIITIIRNTIEPRIVGKQIGLSPIMTLVAMFTGLQTLGVVGLFGFPVTLSILVNLHEAGVISLFKFNSSNKQ